jgi:hypothetical protein
LFKASDQREAMATGDSFDWKSGKARICIGVVLHDSGAEAIPYFCNDAPAEGSLAAITAQRQYHFSPR